MPITISYFWEEDWSGFSIEGVTVVEPERAFVRARRTEDGPVTERYPQSIPETVSTFDPPPPYPNHRQVP